VIPAFALWLWRSVPHPVLGFPTGLYPVGCEGRIHYSRHCCARCKTCRHIRTANSVPTAPHPARTAHTDGAAAAKAAWPRHAPLKSGPLSSLLRPLHDVWGTCVLQRAFPLPPTLTGPPTRPGRPSRRRPNPTKSSPSRPSLHFFQGHRASRTSDGPLELPSTPPGPPAQPARRLQGYWRAGVRMYGLYDRQVLNYSDWNDTRGRHAALEYNVEQGERWPERKRSACGT